MEVEGVILIMENLLQFFSRNKDALLAIGVLLTFFVSIISLYFLLEIIRQSTMLIQLQKVG